MIIFGNKTKREPVGYAWGQTCYGASDCASSGPALWGVLQKSSKFTLYFIPTFTYSKGTEYVCVRCGQHIDFDQMVPNSAELYPTVYRAIESAPAAVTEALQA